MSNTKTNMGKKMSELTIMELNKELKDESIELAIESSKVFDEGYNEYFKCLVKLLEKL